MGDKKITTVYETEDYSRFKIIEGNRKLDHTMRQQQCLQKGDKKC